MHAESRTHSKELYLYFCEVLKKFSSFGRH